MVIFFTQMVVCSTALAREKQVICIVKFIQISQKLKWKSKTLFCSKKIQFFHETKYINEIIQGKEKWNVYPAEEKYCLHSALHIVLVDIRSVQQKNDVLEKFLKLYIRKAQVILHQLFSHKFWKVFFKNVL